MPGLRIGIVEIPMELQSKILWAKYSSDISTPGLIQKSMYYYMSCFNWDEYLNNISKLYYEKYSLAKKLIEENLSEKLKVRNAVGGINFFLELPRGYSANDFYNFILEKGVIITPGTYFFDNIMDDRYFRINVANASLDDIREGISIISENLDAFFSNYKERNNLRSNKIFY